MGFGSLPLLAILPHLGLSVFILVASKRARVCSPLVCKSLAWGGEKGIKTICPKYFSNVIEARKFKIANLNK